MDRVDERSSKRRRIDAADGYQAQPVIHADQLYEMLRFRQSILPEVKMNINSFKDFVSGINRNEDLASQARQLQILRKYCSDQAAPSKEHIDFPDLISTWSHAAESNNDSICSAIPAALAQFFRTISSIIEFREFGLSLCHSLLKRDQVKLIDRGLSASKTKEHLISPCLRLLTEMVSFDGGAMANHVFARRDVLFKRLDGLLDQAHMEPSEDRRRATVRRMALRLVIANLRYLDTAAKSEFITQLRIIRATTRGLPYDGDDIVVEILHTIDSSIVEDTEVLRVDKSRFLGLDVLTSLASLYRYEPDPNHEDSESRVRSALQSLFSKVCATRKGILMLQNGWYPVGFDNQLYRSEDNNFVDLGLDSPLYFDDYSTIVPVKNDTLSSFIQVLKPESDTLQAQLLLQIFKAAPELVANYFSKNTKLLVQPGDSAAWRGQFAFLFSVAQLPVPKNLASSDTIPALPPPISIVVESIMSRPLDRTVMSRCFTLNDEILILSGSRLLTVTLEKLDVVLKIFVSADGDRQLWQQASARLIEAVLQRVPKLRDITDTVYRFSTDNEQVRTSLFECITAYYRILPEATASSRFDPSPIMLEIIARVASNEIRDETKDLLREQVSYLTAIAQLSPATKWLQKSNMDTLSLFSSLLQCVSVEDSGNVEQKTASVLKSVASSTGFLCSFTISSACLERSLQSSKKFVPTNELYLFIDNSIVRAVQKPVRYLDQNEKVQRVVSDTASISLLACSIAEQWNFALKKYLPGQKAVIKNISDWIARFYDTLDSAGENSQALNHFREAMINTADEKAKEYIQRSFEKVRKNPVDVVEAGAAHNSKDAKHTGIALGPTRTKIRSVDLHEMLKSPALLPTSLEGIDRWDNKTDIDLAMQSGRIAKLIRCSASPEEEVRRQGFQFLQNLAHIVDESAYAEKVQVYLLIGELCETIRQYGLDKPLPSAAAELGVQLLQILSDPSHKLFGKANRFVLRGPSWELRKLISHWTDKIMFHEPESDDASAWAEEVEWLLQWLVDGLKTEGDMEIYRRSGVFEKVLVLYANPGLGRTARRLVLTLVWRAVCTGGANTLITRAGVHKWLDVAASLDIDQHNIIEELHDALVKASDEELIANWRETRPALRAE